MSATGVGGYMSDSFSYSSALVNARAITTTGWWREGLSQLAAALAVVGLETGCDDFDSDVEVIGARLHGVNVYGNGLIVGQVGR